MENLFSYAVQDKYNCSSTCQSRKAAARFASQARCESVYILDGAVIMTCLATSSVQAMSMTKTRIA